MLVSTDGNIKYMEWDILRTVDALSTTKPARRSTFCGKNNARPITNWIETSCGVNLSGPSCNTHGAVPLWYPLTEVYVIIRSIKLYQSQRDCTQATDIVVWTDIQYKQRCIMSAVCSQIQVIAMCHIVPPVIPIVGCRKRIEKSVLLNDAKPQAVHWPGQYNQ